MDKMTTSRRVARSLTHRVFGGVCGGLSLYLGINPWWGRLLTVLLAVLSGGVAALLYLILWWTLPPNLTPDTPTTGRDVGRLLAVAALVALTGAVVLARAAGILTGPGGADLFWPGMVMALGAALLWTQIRG